MVKETIFSGYLWPAITFVLGLITQHLFGLYKNKIAKVRYSINKTFLGVSGEDNIFGKVQVLYNNIPVKNLFLCNITLINTSNKDFKDVTITAWCDTGSILLISRAHKSSSINSLNLTQEFLQEAAKNMGNNPSLFLSRRPYAVPVFNRDDNVIFSCLVTNDKGAEPNIYLDCEHEGLRLEPSFVRPLTFWGENQTHGAWCGLIICALLSLMVVNYIQSKFAMAIVVYFLGALCLIPGVIYLKIVKRLKKIIR
jgi:hypothetical protein